MGKGIIRVDAQHGSEWFAHGKSHSDVKDLLKLPASYQVEDIKADSKGALHITVSSPDIPEVAEGFDTPDIIAKFDAREGHKEGTWDKEESYKLTALHVVFPLNVEQ
jgi:hypothetical protein